MTPYAEVLLASHDARRLYSEFVAIAAAHELGIRVPKVRFFVHRPTPDGWPLESWSDGRRLAGEARSWQPDAVWVLADLPRSELGAVVAHEVHHLSYFSRFGSGCFTPREQVQMEVDAESFASNFMHPRTRNGE